MSESRVPADLQLWIDAQVQEEAQEVTKKPEKTMGRGAIGVGAGAKARP